jgi:putative hydroxymethylpyrimidine transport system ATP-binding protein
MVIRNLHFSFPSRKIFENFDLDLGDTGVTAFLGKSGCGKTTLFNLIAGLLTPLSGEINHGGQESITYTFQDPSLLPWLTVIQNLMFIWPENLDIRQGYDRAIYLLEVSGLAQWQKAYPAQLSGGMRQRLSLIRACMNPGKIILMDEPLKGLDPAAKQSMFDLLQTINSIHNSLILWTTHDVDEALLIAKRIIVLDGQPLKITGDFLTTATTSLERLTDDAQNVIRRDIYRLLLKNTATILQ